MTTEPDSQENLSLYEFRERQRKAKAASEQSDPNVEARRQWLNDLDSQRQHLFDALYELNEFDEEKYRRAIEAVKEGSEGDAEDIYNASWTVKSLDDLPGLIHRNTWACLRQIAMLDLAIKQLKEQFHTACKHQTAPESLRHVLLLPTKVERSAPSLLDIMARGYQLLGAINILQNRENFLHGRRRGNNRKPKASDTQHLVTTMTKLLYQAEPLRNARVSENELTRHYVEKLLNIWAEWPFFPLNDLEANVRQAVKELDLPLEKNKALYKRRMRTPMARPRREQDIPYITEKESYARECEARQVATASALMQVMEAKFGELSDQNKAVIGQSSPEQLGVWLRCVHDANGNDDLLAMADTGGKR